MKSIGGFFELEMRDAVEYHRHALRLNSGRNALEYVLRARRYRKVHLPLYTCDVLFQPIVRLGIASAVYHINEHFEPVFDFASLRQDEALVYVNYFGLFDDVIESVAKKCSSLIVDNAQAFYARPVPGVDTFYSPRKFFGIPDGAYLYTDHRLTEPLERDKSYERCEHLLRRIDRGPEDAYPRFLESDEVFDTLPLRRMSSLTCRLLKSIDYDEVARRRISNFGLLHEALKGMNSIDCEPGDGQVPMGISFPGAS